MVLRGWERVAWAWTWVGPSVDLLVGWEGFVLVGFWMVYCTIVADGRYVVFSTGST